MEIIVNNVSVSVIVPVYNSEEYVSSAIESILAQNLDGMELILIDDGSIDSSGAICDSFAKRDSRVRVYHQPNGGMCAARNFAMSIAQGEYIAFADNDDIMLPGCLRSNYLLAKQHDADCVRYGRKLIMTKEDGTTIYSSIVCPKELSVVKGNQLRSSFRTLMYCEGVWTGLFRNALIRSAGMQFNERLRHGGEDRLFIAQFYQYVNCVVLNPEVGYEWHRRVGHSASVSLDKNKLLGLSLSTQAEYSLMTSWEIKKSDPSFYGERLVSSLMTSLRDCAYADGMISRLELHQTLASIRTLYRTYEKDLRHVPLGLMSSIVYHSLMKGIDWPARLYIELVRHEVKSKHLN